MKIAITYQHSLTFGGSERVLAVLARMYPAADFFCMAARREAIPAQLVGRAIHTSFLNSVPAIRTLYPYLLAVGALAAETLDVSGYDLVISADGSHTMGVITHQDTVHLCYCHSPHRSLWDQYAEYRNALRWPARALFTLSAHYARGKNFEAAQRIDAFAANSIYIAKRIRKFYKRESRVIYPPVNTASGNVAETEGLYYLSVGRLTHLKRTDILIKACTQLRRKLVIVGTGPDEKRLKRIAGASIEFVGRVPDAELGSMYRNCRALLFAADEDFGIVPVEAQSFGRPVIAYGHGGSLETVIDSGTPATSTGILFPEQTVESLCAALARFECVENQFVPVVIQKHASRFSTEAFIENMSLFVSDATESAHSDDKASAISARTKQQSFVTGQQRSPREATHHRAHE